MRIATGALMCAVLLLGSACANGPGLFRLKEGYPGEFDFKGVHSKHSPYEVPGYDPETKKRATYPARNPLTTWPLTTKLREEGHPFVMLIPDSGTEFNRMFMGELRYVAMSLAFIAATEEEVGK